MITGGAEGRASEEIGRGDVSALALAPEVILLAVVLLLGVALPGPLAGSIEEAGAIVMSYEGENSANGDLFADALAALGTQDQPELDDVSEMSDVSEVSDVQEEIEEVFE